MPKAHQQSNTQEDTAANTVANTATNTATSSGQTAKQNQPADQNELSSKLATVAAVGIGAALIEVELIPGMLLGVAAMLIPNLLPRLGNGIRPLVKGAVRAGYSVAERTKETVAEANEHFQDIVAEVRSEQNTGHSPQFAGSTSGESTQPA